MENKDEKWQKISEFVDKSVVECLERVQWCKKKAAESSSSGEEDSEENSDEEGDSDDESFENDGYYRENDSDVSEDDEENNEEEEKKQEFQFGVDFNVIVSLMDISMSGISICRIASCNV